MTNTIHGNIHIAFVRRGVQLWDEELDGRFFVSDTHVPHEANFEGDDLRVVEALLDRDFPDRRSTVLVVNETDRFGRDNVQITADVLQQLPARNKTELFLGTLPLSRRIDFISRMQFFRERDSGLAAGAILLSLPGYSADRRRAALPYTLVQRRGDAYERGWAIALLDRTSDGWRVISNQFHRDPTEILGADVPLRVGGDVKPPVIIRRDKPQFPPGIGGMILLETIIGKDGQVKEVTVLKALNPGADRIAVDAVRHWQFRPGTLNGAAVSTIYTIPISVP